MIDPVMRDLDRYLQDTDRADALEAEEDARVAAILAHPQTAGEILLEYLETPEGAGDRVRLFAALAMLERAPPEDRPRFSVREGARRCGEVVRAAARWEAKASMKEDGTR